MVIYSLFEVDFIYLHKNRMDIKKIHSVRASAIVKTQNDADQN